MNLISALDIERLLRSGFVAFISDKDIKKRKARAEAEVEHFCHIVEKEPMGTHIGLLTGTQPHTGFQIFRTGSIRTVTISPFRLGEQPNVSLGIAMITSTEEAVSLHEKLVDQMWQAALKGKAVADYFRNLINSEQSRNRRK